MKNKIERNINIEILRILSMMIIVIYHYHAREFNTYVLSNDIISDPDLMPSLLLHSFGKLGVPVFVFISGYYGIKFKMNRMVDILSTSLFYALLSCIGLYFIYDINAFKSVVFFINNWWFIAAYICLYIMAPAINNFIDSTNKWTLLCLICIFYYISFGDISVNSANIGGLYLIFTMYLFSRWISKYCALFFRKYCLLLFISLLILRIVIIYISYNTTHIGILPYLNSYVNPLSILTAAAIFYIFERMPTFNIGSKIIMFFSSSALSVYLLSESGFGQRFFESLYPTKGNYDLLHFVYATIIVYVVITLIDKGYMFIYSIIKQKINSNEI